MVTPVHRTEGLSSQCQLLQKPPRGAVRRNHPGRGQGRQWRKTLPRRKEHHPQKPTCPPSSRQPAKDGVFQPGLQVGDFQKVYNRHTASKSSILLKYAKQVKNHMCFYCSLKTDLRTSLVAQWLRIRLLIQGTWVRTLAQEDPTCRRATRPVSHNY